MLELEIDFKYKNLKEQLEKADPRLRAVLFELVFLVKSRFNKKLLVTHIQRTQKEQNLLYRDKMDKGFFIWVRGKRFYSADKKRPTFSPHQTRPCRAVDLRSRCFTDDEILEMKKHLDFWFPYGGGKPTFLCHKNSGEHIHLQVPAK